MGRFTILGVVCGMLIAAETAEAQWVRTGPGGGISVWAPFVHVEVAPNGRTYVAAPFTSVLSPGYGRIGPRYEYPYRAGWVTPNRISNGAWSQFRPLTADEFAEGAATAAERTPTDPTQMDWRQLRRHTRVVAASFEGELRRAPDGPAWAASLRPGTIRDLLADDGNRPPDSSTVEQLAAIRQSYDALAESDGYPQIAGLGGFREMREALGELTSPPLQRQRRMLAAQWAVLRTDLGQFETGASWQSYLEPPREVIDPVSGMSGSTGEATERERQVVEETLARYEQIPGTEDYRAIVELQSFEQTRRFLADYLQNLKNSSSHPVSDSPQSETIPPPRPVP